MNGSSDISFDMPREISVLREFSKSIKSACEIVIEKPMLLEPGRYTVILGELRKVVYKTADDDL